MKIISQPATKGYRENWERIWGPAPINPDSPKPVGDPPRIEDPVPSGRILAELLWAALNCPISAKDARPEDLLPRNTSFQDLVVALTHLWIKLEEKPNLRSCISAEAYENRRQLMHQMVHEGLRAFLPRKSEDPYEL